MERILGLINISSLNNNNILNYFILLLFIKMLIRYSFKKYNKYKYNNLKLKIFGVPYKESAKLSSTFNSKEYERLNNINYRVKWALGKWYDTSEQIFLPNKNYFIHNDYLIKDHYPLLKIIMRDTNHFLYHHGDVQHSVGTPCFTKTRPIDDKTNIIILLGFERHWKKVLEIQTIDKAFEQKRNIAIWRGTTTGCPPHLPRRERPGNRFTLVEKWYNKNENIDVGFSFICQEEETYKEYVKGQESIEHMLQYKYLICAEGNDVASGLKWMLYSKSVVLMPKPTTVSWFMEDHLVPFKHYVPIKDDWSDLLKMYTWCENNQDKCKVIIKCANEYVHRFIDEFESGFAGVIHDEITRIYRKNFIFT